MILVHRAKRPQLNSMTMMTIFMIGLLNIHYTWAHWAGDGPTGNGLGKLSALDVICGKDHMTVRAEFAGPFHGIVFSKGTYGQDNCVYIKPYSGVTHATFKVYYDQCGTKPDLQGKYYENTVVIQYGTDIIEAWDEAKRLRCEWFEAYEKPATFRPAIPVADLDVVEMNFQGDDIDCWMEIQEGKGPFGREVSRIVPVGQPMTIVIAINDYGGEFDMRVKSCFAHDGVKPPIHMTDEHGCVLRPKMLTKFQKVRDPNGKATVISYSHFYAFKFPDSMNVQIQCTVEVCRHGCPEACSKAPYHRQPDRQFKQQISLSYGSESSGDHSQGHPVIPANMHSEVASELHERQHIAPQQSSVKEAEQHSSQDLQNSGSHLVSSGSPSSSSVSSSVSDHQMLHHQGFDLKRLPVYRDQEVPNNGSSVSSESDKHDGDDIAENDDKQNFDSQSDKVDDQKPSSSQSAFNGNEGHQHQQGHHPVLNSHRQTLHHSNKPHHPPSLYPNSQNQQEIPTYTEEISEEGKPVFIPGFNGNHQDLLANLPPDSYDKASQLFKDLGMNVDLSNLASGFVDGMNTRNLAHLLENDKVRELAEASGIKLNERDHHHLSPEVQPLISGPITSVDSLGDNDEEDRLTSDELEAASAAASGHNHQQQGVGGGLVNGEHLTSPAPTASYPLSETGQPIVSSQSGSQVTLTDEREKGQLSGNISSSNNILSMPSLPANNSSKPAMSGIRRQPQNNHQLRAQQQQHHQQQIHHQHQQQQVHPHHHNQQVFQSNNFDSEPQGINQPFRSHHPAAHPASPSSSSGLGLENPVAQVVSLQLGIPPIGLPHQPPTYNNFIPQPPTGSRQKVNQQQKHHQQQQPIRLPHHHQQPHLKQKPPQHHLQRQPGHQQQMAPGRPQHLIRDGPPRPAPPQQQQPPQHISNLPIHKATSLLASLGSLPNFGLPFLSSIQRQDTQPPLRPHHLSSVPFPHGPRSFRSKRSPNREPYVSVKKGFQVVTSIDLAFMPNTTDLPEIYEGRREDIVYGVCMPFNGLITALSIVASIIGFSIVSSFILMKKLNRLRNSKTEICS